MGLREKLTFDNYVEPEYKVNDHRGVIVGKSPQMVTLFAFLNHLANLPTTVLLRGETGTGKELFARALHYNGKGDRKKNKFVAVNCAGIPNELLETLLFGAVKGAYTGAVSRSGNFQYANNGTILLDEIGDMSYRLQAKLLRVLQEKEVTKVGANNAEPVNVRVIAATNRNYKKVKESEVFKIPFGKGFCYVLTPDKVQYFIGRNVDPVEATSTFEKEIDEFYREFIEWEPPGLFDPGLSE